MNKPLQFNVLDKVRKIGGGYQANGTIVAAFHTLAGEDRYVFEFTAFPGMLHIFGPSQLTLTTESK